MRNRGCCFRLVLNFTSEAQHARRRLRGKAAGNAEVTKGWARCPCIQDKVGSHCSPLSWLPAQEGRLQPLAGTLPAEWAACVTQTHSSAALGPVCVRLGPWHPAGITLTLRLCLSHRPQASEISRRFSDLSLSQLITFISACDGSGNVCLSWMHTRAQSLVFTQTLQLHICTTTMKSFHPKLTLQSRY